MEWKRAAPPFRSHGGIRYRLLWMGLLFLGVALLINTVAGSLYTRRQIKRAAAQLQTEVASKVANQIADIMSRKTERLMDLAVALSLYDPGADGQRLLTLLMLKNDRAFTEIAVLDRFGREVINISERRVYLDNELSNRSIEEYFRQGIKGESYLSPVYTTDKAEPYVKMAVPIMEGPGRISGVVVAEVNLTFLWQIIGDVKFSEAGNTYLVDGQGNLIAHADPSLVLRRTNLHDHFKVREFLARPAQKDANPAEEGMGLMGRLVLSTYAPVRGLGWAVVLTEPVDVALADLSVMERYAVLLLFVGVMVGSLLIIWVSNKITAPIRELHRGVEVIRQGKLDHRVDIATGDEIEQLAKEFNEMASELKNSYSMLEQRVEQRAGDLAALYDVTTAVNQSLDLAPVLQQVIQKVTAVFRFDASGVFLFDPQTKELFLRAASGSSPDFWRSPSRYRFGHGVAGRVAETGEAIAFEDITRDARYQEFSRTHEAERAGIRFFAVFPITTKLETVGIVVCLCHEARRLTEDESRLLASMCDQIGVAVEKANLFEQTSKRATEIATLYDVTKTVNQSLDLDSTLQEVIKKFNEIFVFNSTRIFLSDPQTGEQRVHASYSTDPAGCQTARVFHRGEGIIGRVAETGEPIIFEDVRTDATYRQLSSSKNTQRAGKAFLAVFPIMAKFKTIGTILCNGAEPRHLALSEIQLIASMAGQIGVAVENARLYSEMKQKSIELEKANQDMEAASRAKRDFLAAMSHELRTPLNVIIGNADLCKDGFFGGLTGKQRDAMEKVLRYSRILLKLINDVLTLTKIEAKKMSLDLTTFEVDEVIEQVQNFVEQLNHGGGVKISWKVPAKLPPLSTDALKLEEILQNLIGNAYKFTPSGTIEIRVRDLPSEHRIEFVVADTGIGIKPDNLDKIFDEFHQLEEAHTGQYSGVGLGLSIIKKYLELMLGDIRVESEPGVGTTFTFTLPYSFSEAVVAHAEMPLDFELPS
ncbi:MAG TPA: GAF domain-containing protein [Verrucomicrobiae bacterium]|jgi:signal transduction histidine kinase|nr:GAF domain-containing protein [Verrucomicrobiae bacterium]